MLLKDGNISGLVIGAILTIAGGYFFYHLYFTSGISSTVWIALAVLVFEVMIALLSSSITVGIDKSQKQISFLKKDCWAEKSKPTTPKML